MKKLFLFLALTGAAWAGEPAFTPVQLAATAATDNAELKFYEAQVAALPKPLETATPEIPQPLEFPSRDAFRRAVLNLDADLAHLYLAEFRHVLASDVRIKAMEYEAATKAAATAADLASRISALVKMLEERPAAGVESLIERRILEGAALPFVRQAAELKVRAALLRTELNGLLGRPPDASLIVKGGSELPPESTPQGTADSLLLSIREAQIARGLAGLEAAADVEPYEIGGWFTREGLGASGPFAGVTRPGPTSGTSAKQTRERLLDDGQRKLARETRQRQAAVAAAREVVNAIPPLLVENLQSASDLAERQYRVGALGVNLLIEIHREYLDALKARNEALIQAWRNALDLELLTAKSPSGTGIRRADQPSP